jgi:hypothetical protein
MYIVVIVIITEISTLYYCSTLRAAGGPCITDPQRPPSSSLAVEPSPSFGRRYPARERPAVGVGTVSVGDAWVVGDYSEDLR